MSEPTAVFDNFAQRYSFWIERINPPFYDNLVGKVLRPNVNLALDAGCGPGFLTRYLANYAQHVVSLDLSESMLDLARHRQCAAQKGNVSFVRADLHCPPFEAASFDLIASDCVLHDTNIDVALPALARLLRPGGRLIVRDIVAHNPARANSPTWQFLRTLRQIPRYVKRFGLKATVRVLSFELSPTWIRHKCEGNNITPAAFRAIYGRHLPDSIFRDFGWAMAALWKAPT